MRSLGHAFICVLLLCAGALFAAETDPSGTSPSGTATAATQGSETDAYPWSGLPALQRFPPGVRPGGLQSFAVTETPRGEILVANADGILRYFGGRWSQLDVPSMATARSLAVASDGSIYVGGYHHFGRLERAADGRYSLVDLDELFFPEGQGAPLAEVWDVLPSEDGVYFGTASELFRVANDGQHQRWQVTGGMAASYRVGGEIWVRSEAGELLALRQGELQALIGEVPRLVSVWAQRDANGERVLLLTQQGRFQELINGRLIDLPFAGGQLLADASPYCLLRLTDGSIVVGTLAGEVFWYEADLRLRQHWPASSFPILSMGSDRENGLWLATDNEVLRLDLSPRWSLLGPDRGYRGTLLGGGLFGKEVLIGTSMGLFRDLGDGQLELLGLQGQEVRHIVGVNGGALIGTVDGIVLRADDTLQRVVSDANVLYLLPSKRFPGVVYSIEESGLLILASEQGKWTETQRVIDPAYRFQSLAEANNGFLWAGQIGDDPMHMQLSADGRNVIGATRQMQGLRRPSGTDSNVFGLDGEIYVATDAGLHRWTGDRFLSDDLGGLEQQVGKQLSQIQVQECASGQTLIATGRQLLLRGADGWQAAPAMDGQAQGVIELNCGNTLDSFISTWAGLARFRPSAEAKQTSAAITPVMEVVESGDRDQRQRLNLKPASAPSVAAGSSLRFVYALPTFDYGWKMESRLSPQETHWVSDPGLGMREFSAQSPGDFEFQVRAVRDDSAAPELLRYPLRVVPRWYQTWWTQIAGLALLLALLGLIVQWRLRRLAMRNQALELTVDQRTADLQARSQELENANLRLRELADQDGLTGVANRRRLQRDLTKAFAEATATDQHLAVLMIDLDHFKQFNDRYGHLQGDEELRRAARGMAEALRWNGGLLARYGGEEFVVMLPNADLTSAVAEAAALRSVLNQMEQDRQSLTVSIGVAERKAHGAQSVESLLEQADQALYLAKHAGRDRVEIFRR